MARFPLRVVCFDNQPAAQRRAYHLCSSLSAFGGRTINIQFEAKDPAEALFSSSGRKDLSSIRQILGG
jgi:hypothetical protein